MSFRAGEVDPQITSTLNDVGDSFTPPVAAAR